MRRSKSIRTMFSLCGAAGLCALLACCSSMPNATVADKGPDTIATLDSPPGSNEDFIINVGRRIYFNDNSADLTDTAKVTLDKQAQWLNTYPTYKVKIEGFADEKGSGEFNKALGLKRAEATRAYLVAQGVNPGRLRVKSFGNDADRLVKKCEDISCRSQNRRVVTVLDTEVES
jgi:peptidoglycan-associated lipoprotein